MFRGFYWRIAIPFVLLIVGSISILGFYLAGQVRESQIDNLRSHLEKEARLTTNTVQSYLLTGTETDELDALTKELGNQINTRVTVIAPDGTVLGDSEESPATMENHASRPEIVAALTQGIGEGVRFSTTLGQRMMYVAVPVFSQGNVIGIVRLALPLTTVESSINRWSTTIVLAATIAAVLAILATLLISRATTRPIRRMTGAVKRVASGKLGEKIAVPGYSELGQLAHAFNEMSQSLKNTMSLISEEKGKLATVLAGITDGVIMTDTETNIVLANPAAERLFNFQETTARGRLLIEIVREYEVVELLKACLKARQEQATQFESSSRRFLRAIAIPLAKDRITGALILFQDLTELQSVHTMRREFVANLSHELRTPLAAIKAVVETLQDGAIDDKKTALEFLARVDSEVERMTQMVRELTELSRIEMGRAELRLEPMEVNSLIAEIISRFSPQAERQGLALSAKLSNSPIIVRADQERIQQVIGNLVHNAIKFTPTGGRITVSSGLQKDSVVVSVSDTGIGISSQDLPHIFERFYKADKARSGGGTGLGLAIAKHVVQAHNGRIWVESEEGKGSTFNFSLPLEANAKQ
ncbi:MAG: HAMP domain-containing protein [Chloroflexi bacterium]|nr:HAMP domain-containing protein [Chloroflexota bacterium]